MFHCFPGELHPGSRSQHETVTQTLGTGKAFVLFLRRIFRGDGLFGTKATTQTFPGVLLGDEPREGSVRVFADDIGGAP